MQAFFTPGLREMWIACGTKYGKTIAASSAQVSRAWLKRGGMYRWVAPIYSQALIGFNYAQKLLPIQPFIQINKSDPSITIPHTAARLEFKSGKYPEDLEGEACNGYVLDECSKMSQQVYDSAWTTTTVTKGPIMAISTPRGKNWFYTKCMQAKEEMEWARGKGINPSKLFITAPTADNPNVSKETIEQARHDLPERLFRQYYLAEFVDDGSCFLGFRQCVFGDLNNEPYWITEPTGEVVIGADWAKSEDRTVFIAIDLATKKVCGYWRYYKIPYTESIRRLVTFAAKFKNGVACIFHDKTGLGTVIDDQLAYSTLPYRGITFTNALKSDLVAKLMTSFEQKALLIPNWQDMLDELDCYELSTNALGTTTYSAPSGKHDDIVSALFLAHGAMLEYGEAKMEVRALEDLPQDKSLDDLNPFLMDEDYDD